MLGFGRAILEIVLQWIGFGPRRVSVWRLLILVSISILVVALVYEYRLQQPVRIAPLDMPGKEQETQAPPLPDSYQHYSTDTDAPASTFQLPNCEYVPHSPNCKLKDIEFSFTPLKKAEDQSPTSLRILQFGDSHTASDFLSGEIRLELQAKYGDGGPGLVVAGKPYKSFRSNLVDNNTTSGWTYNDLMDRKVKIALPMTGFLAEARDSDQSLTFNFKHEIESNVVDVIARFGTADGTFDIKVNVTNSTFVSLRSEHAGYQYVPIITGETAIKKIELKTRDAGPVAIGGLLSLHPKSGVSFSAIGFPGATVSILKSFHDDIVRQDLLKLSPQIVIIAFGTNEGFDDDLKSANYKADYASILDFIRSVLPDTQIIIALPPEGARSASKSKMKKVEGCDYVTPPNLSIVHDIQSQLGIEKSIPVWDWSALMPKGCNLEEWVTATPKLMAPDRIHLTRDGYQLVAKDLTRFLIPYVERRLVSRNAVSNN